MTTLNGIKGDHRLIGIINDNQKAMVTSIFNNSLNMQVKDSLLTIIDSLWGYIPLGILVDLKKSISFKDIGIKPDTKVILSEEMIHIGDMLKIDLKNCLWLKRVIERKNSNEKIIYSNLDRTKKILAEKRTDYGLMSLLDHIDLIINDRDDNILDLDPLSSRAFRFLKHFFKELKKEDKGSAIKSLESLLGLGCGTTPSGDDILMGIIASFNYLDYLTPQDYPEVLKESIRRRTTLISQKYLIEATEGNISERLKNYIEALLYGRSEKVLQEAIMDLTAVGASSGKEIMLGTIMAGEFYKNKTNTKHKT